MRMLEGTTTIRNFQLAYCRVNQVDQLLFLFNIFIYRYLFYVFHFSVADQPRQQDPPSIADDDVLWLPSLVQSQLSETVDGSVLEWVPRESLAHSSTSRVLEPSCELKAPNGVPSSSSLCVTRNVTMEEQVIVNNEKNCSVGDNRSRDADVREIKCTLELIRQGVKLRKTETTDRSAPRLH